MPHWSSMPNLRVLRLSFNQFSGTLDFLGGLTSINELEVTSALASGVRGLRGVLTARDYQRWYCVVLVTEPHHHPTASTTSLSIAPRSTSISLFLITNVGSLVPYVLQVHTTTHRPTSYHTSIQLQHNKFSGALPASLSTLRNLRVIQLQHNRLTDISTVDFNACTPKLKHIDLSHNKVNELNPKLSLAYDCTNVGTNVGTVPEVVIKWLA